MRLHWNIKSGDLNRVGWGATALSAAKDALRREVSKARTAARLGLIMECVPIGRVAKRRNGDHPYYCDTKRVCEEIGAWRGKEGQPVGTGISLVGSER